MAKLEDRFKFWCPIEKAQDLIDPTTGEKVMRLGGIASTSDEDSDGEFLDPKGFDIKPLLESGMVNWHHQAKGQPAAIIGEPSKAEIRPEGLYIETDLYPSSKIACDVWELAETLERDSKTRRLGYSIEGRVLKRKSNDKNSPDYKRIVKAVITGVAITHQPKNPKTFANIIKGEIDEDEEEVDMFEDNNNSNNEKDKALDTETGKALKKESVDKKIKNQTFGKSEVMERLFKDIPGISIEKANKVYSLILKVSSMKKNERKVVTEEDISKAYEALGLEIEPTDIQKGEDGNEEEEEAAEETSAKKPKTKVSDDSDDEGTDSDDEVEEGEKGGKMKKGGTNRFDRIEKAIAASHQINSKYIKALGVMIKDVSQKMSSLSEENESLRDIIKSQEETISMMSERLEAFGSGVPAPKSLGAARPVERTFGKAENDLFEKGEGAEENANQVSMSRQPNVVAELLDQATFAKGYDDEFSRACTAFEASKTLPQNIISRMKNEYGVEIVK